MRIKQTSQHITVGVVILSVLTVACALVSRQFRSSQEEAYATRLEALRMADQLADGSDRLTAAVRAYAATGERRYLDAFERELKVDCTRDKAVERLNQMGLTVSELSLLKEAKRNSDSLVSLENRAFEAAGKKDFTTAIGLVYGEEYRKAKESIMQPISECRSSLEARLTRQAGDLASRAKVLTNIALGTMFANVAAIIGALLFFYRKRVVTPLVTLNESLRDLIAHKKGVSIGYQQDQSEIGEAARSLESYRRAAEEGEAQRLAKTVLAEIATLLQTADAPEEFARRLMSKLVPLLEGVCGAFFLLDEAAQRFRFIGGYSYPKRDDQNSSFAMGQGIVGQCGKDKKTITLTEIPANYIGIISELIHAPPRAIVVVPILSRERVLGVLEIASFASLTDHQNALLREVVNLATPNLEVLQRNLKTRDLLDQVRITEERTRLILESSAEGIFGTDIEGRITFVNPAACRLLGFRAEELIGEPSHAAFHHHRPDGSEYPKEQCPMCAAYKQGKASRIDDEVLWRKDGSGFPVQYGATPILKDEDEVVIGSVVSFTDITERKRAEQELA